MEIFLQPCCATLISSVLHNAVTGDISLTQMKRNDEKWLKCGAFFTLIKTRYKNGFYISTLTT